MAPAGGAEAVCGQLLLGVSRGSQVLNIYMGESEFMLTKSA